MSATEKQARFAAEFVVDLNATRAAVRAGYSRRTAKAQASRLLTNVNVKALVRKKQEELVRRVEIRREDIVRGLLETIEMARAQGDAQAMIQGAAEINKMLGFYPTVKRRTEVLSGFREADLQCLSDAQLLRMIRGDGRA